MSNDLKATFCNTNCAQPPPPPPPHQEQLVISGLETMACTGNYTGEMWTVIFLYPPQTLFVGGILFSFYTPRKLCL